MMATQAVLTTRDTWRRVVEFQHGCPHDHLAFRRFQFLAMDSSLVNPSAMALLRHPLRHVHLAELMATTRAWLDSHSGSARAVTQLVQSMPHLYAPLLWAASAGGDDPLLVLMLKLADCTTMHEAPPWVVVTLAAAAGHVHILSTLHKSNHAGFTTAAMDAAAAMGHLNAMQFLRDSRPHDGWGTPAAWDLAAANGHLAVLRYMYEHHGKDEPHDAVLMGTKGDLEGATRHNHVDVVQFLLASKQDPCSARAVDYASKGGHLQVVKLLTLARKPASKLAMDWAAEGGHFDVVTYLHANRDEGCTSNAVRGAAKGGHLDVVKFLLTTRQEGVAADAIEMAKRHGHDHVVSWISSYFERTLTEL